MERFPIGKCFTLLHQSGKPLVLIPRRPPLARVRNRQKDRTPARPVVLRAPQIMSPPPPHRRPEYGPQVPQQAANRRWSRKRPHVVKEDSPRLASMRMQRPHDVVKEDPRLASMQRPHDVVKEDPRLASKQIFHPMQLLHPVRILSSPHAVLQLRVRTRKNRSPPDGWRAANRRCRKLPGASRHSVGPRLATHVAMASQSPVCGNGFIEARTSPRPPANPVGPPPPQHGG